MNCKFLLFAFVALFVTGFCSGANPWDMEKLGVAPETFAADQFSKPGVKAVFFEGEPWQGKETRVFAYYGLPEMRAGEKVPGIVLVHGGGGSAFSEWVKLWTSRGYAAIAMDTCGAVSGEGYNNHKRHEFSGPKGWGGFDQTGLPVKDQWTYHAVSAVIRAHSLLCSFTEVDPEMTGLTGISWGGYLTCLVSGVDHRFKFAAPVYGCGFLQENSTWLRNFEVMGKVNADEWTKLWDPLSYMAGANLPMLFVTGTNDFAYPMDSLKKTYSLVPGQVRLSIFGNMPHGQGEGANPVVISAFADQVLKGGDPLPLVKDSELVGGRLKVSFESQEAPVSADLLYTKDTGGWKERTWDKVSASLTGDGIAEADVPADAVAFFINLNDNRGFVVSSPHLER